MASLFGTHTKNTTVIKLRGCSVELQGLSKVGIQDTLVFLMCWGGRLFLKGDRRLDLFCFTKLLTVWHKCPSKAFLLRREVFIPDLNTGVMATLLNDAGIKPCVRDWVNNNLRNGVNSEAQLIKSKEGMPSELAAEVEDS